MKLSMQGYQLVGIGATVDNILTGQRYERAPMAAIGSLYTCGSAAGLTAELNVGGISVTPPTTVNAQNRYPVVPDDVLVDEWEVLEGRLIQVTVVNTTGGALGFFWRVELAEAQMVQG
jgi:hypothetical protein